MCQNLVELLREFRTKKFLVTNISMDKFNGQEIKLRIVASKNTSAN